MFYNEDEDVDGKRDDLVVAGIIENDSKNERWTAIINWNEIKNISKLSIQEKQKLGIK